jgi:hypothetical protein
MGVCDRRVQHPTPCMPAGVFCKSSPFVTPLFVFPNEVVTCNFPRRLQQYATNESPQVRCVLQRDPRQPSFYYEGGCGKWTGGQLCE